MSRRHRRSIKHTPARVLLSDVLPYELPVGFDNVGLYRFLLANKARRNGSRIEFREPNDHVRTVLTILFGRDVTPLKDGGYSIPAKRTLDPTIPFQYSIRHSDGSSRVLSVPHPSSQIGLVDFYDRYKSLLLLHTSTSPFSIRFPNRVSRYTTFNDSVFMEAKAKRSSSIELENRESEHLRSFFTYQRFDNIAKFFESPEYRLHEKRFGHLIKLDIAKCFDSVYTHSISWAIFGKGTAKLGIADRTTFADEFDTRIRGMNDNETHGILIGPEVSRIFAEIILQRVDRDVEQALLAQNLRIGVDYEISRYVDDYSIFLRDLTTKEAVCRTLEACLRPFRFHLNMSKEEENQTPFISAISVASNKLWREIDTHLRIEEDFVHGTEIKAYADFRTTSRELISGYKTILRDTQALPSLVNNSCLSYIERCLEREFENFLTIDSRREEIADGKMGKRVEFYNRRNLARALEASLELAFFVYGGSPKVGSAIKLARISSMVRKAIRTAGCSLDDSGRVDDTVRSEVLILLNRHPLGEGSSIENLYLLTLLSELGEEYALSERQLCQATQMLDPNGRISIPDWYNVLIVSEILRLIARQGTRYTEVVRALEKWSLKRVADFVQHARREAEEPFLVLNLISAPVVSDETKFKLLQHYGVKSRAEALAFANYQEHWFTRWSITDLHSELLLKRVQEVY